MGGLTKFLEEGISEAGDEPTPTVGEDEESEESTGDEDEDAQDDEPGPDEGEPSEESTEGDEDGEPGSEGDEGEQGDDKPESKPSEVEVLRKQVEQMGQQQAALFAALLGNKAQPQAPTKDPTSDVPENVLRLFLFGGSEDEFKRVPAPVLDKARAVAETHAQRETRYALDPSKRYEDQVRQHVVRDMLKIMEPILKDFHDRKAENAVDKHLGSVKDPSVKARARAIFEDLPGSKSDKWEDVEKTLAVAVKAAKSEAQEKQQGREQLKRKAGKIQQQASGAKLKRPGAQNDRTPNLDMQDGESPTAYYNRLLKHLK